MNATLKLNSVVPGGYGGPGAAMLDYIYSYFFKEYKQNHYSFIIVNQINDDLEEFVSKEGKRKVHINIRYPVLDDYENASTMRILEGALEMAHHSLLKIAEFEDKLDVNVLEQIRNKILENRFSFLFIHRNFNVAKKKNVGQVCLLLKPCFDRFEYFVAIRNNNEYLYQQLIYLGLPTTFYVDNLFKTARWHGEDLIVSGARKEVDFIVDPSNKSFAIKNLTIYSPPPLYGMMQWEIPKEQEQKAYDNWIHFIGPTIAASILYNEN